MGATGIKEILPFELSIETKKKSPPLSATTSPF